MPSLQQGVPYFGGQKIFDVFKASSSKIDTNFTWGPTQKTVNLSLQDALAKAVNGDGTVYDALGTAQATAIKSMKDQSIPVSSK
jgi:multiple sugar transport system substrate-binding protein